MTLAKVFIDGEAGTTGLEISQRLQSRTDLELLKVDPQRRKDTTHRQSLINASDITILCLPDTAAEHAASLVQNPSTRLLDASSVHRTAQGWCYGLPELDAGQRQRIRNASRVANPGCYPTGFILSVRPLIEAGILPPELPLTVHAISGYSGGGRQLIERFETQHAAKPGGEWTVRPYCLTLDHKHLPEMQVFSGTHQRPLFSPSVGAFYRGMLTHLPLFHQNLKGVDSPGVIQRILADRYADEAFIRVHATGAEDQLAEGYLSAQARNKDNGVDLMVFGNKDQSLVVARYDNLGKGASGAAIQNLNLMLNFAETCGLKGFHEDADG